jgi:predicted RNA binding protein YcfA (HicA-like mRNA interferase family)
MFKFSEMVALVEAFGFELTPTKGSHFIFTHPEIPELINLQEKNGKAKPYQVREFL